VIVVPVILETDKHIKIDLLWAGIIISNRQEGALKSAHLRQVK